MSESEAERSMHEKVCLVTGATGGIGLVTASELAQHGAAVIGVGRSEERCAAAEEQIRRETGSGSVRYVVADLSSQAEIRRLAREIQDSTPRLDVLINNAGGIYLTRQETADGLEMTFAVNHLAYFLLTNLLLDLVKASAPSRIVSVSSAAHQGCTLDFGNLQSQLGRFSAWRAYQRSKLANILFTRELSRRLEGMDVTANALHPGYVRTQIFRAEGVRGWVLRRAADLFAISPEQGALTSLYLATAAEVEGISGKYFAKQKPVISSPQSRDDELARKLWEKSAELTGLSA
jgi:NAD(P)-dependent dehydrogenase (short-subunit alcohol dehydrogenase family)